MESMPTSEPQKADSESVRRGTIPVWIWLVALLPVGGTAALLILTFYLNRHPSNILVFNPSGQDIEVYLSNPGYPEALVTKVGPKSLNLCESRLSPYGDDFALYAGGRLLERVSVDSKYESRNSVDGDTVLITADPLPGGSTEKSVRVISK